ncbi:hypothetical protein [Clostridium tagluense]|uniref:Uncharacterized protein n=1 Tax=Clostridium tagluense TaxID=360422 RepID=A0A401UQF7_9CLOT|nr:hypothetical protein [Clostridium tagluense]GCD11769.1 hypothetical protein Ctaglu_33920 [Clostridium tagluense]
MNINDIIIMEQSNMKNSIPLINLNNKVFEDIIISFGLNIADFYKVEGKLYPYCYAKETVLVEIYEMSTSFFKDFRVKEQIVLRTNRHNECIATNNYKSLFCLIDKPFRFMMYKKLFDDIPDNQKYEIFESIYTSSEYGFNSLSKKFIEKVFKYNKKSQNCTSTDVIIIYRGEGEKSTPYKKSYSWTTDIKVAEWFANRFSDNGKVYKAKVYVKDILAHIEDKSEHEVIVLPNKIFNVIQIK